MQFLYETLKGCKQQWKMEKHDNQFIISCTKNWWCCADWCWLQEVCCMHRSLVLVQTALVSVGQISSDQFRSVQIRSDQFWKFNWRFDCSAQSPVTWFGSVFCSVVGQIEAMFQSSRKQRNWDHFTKAQRKNLDQWFKQTEVRPDTTGQVWPKAIDCPIFIERTARSFENALTGQS